MKYNVNANDFCPDDCPYCEIETHNYGGEVYGCRYMPPYVETVCIHEERCEKAYKLGYDKGNSDAYDEIADKYIESKERYTIDELMAKIHSRYDFGERITDYDAYMLEWLKDIESEDDYG